MSEILIAAPIVGVLLVALELLFRWFDRLGAAADKRFTEQRRDDLIEHASVVKVTRYLSIAVLRYSGVQIVALPHGAKDGPDAPTVGGKSGGANPVSVGQIRCQFIILARKDEPTPDYARHRITPPTPDYAPKR